MNLPDLQNKLLAAARRQPPDNHVPYAFEKRIMARLADSPRPGDWVAWSRALWFGAAACTTVALLTSVWAPSMNEDDSSFSLGVEQTIMASSDDFDRVR